ncbi:MAG: NAD(P)/FAD-dependent oxidoreductase [Brevinematia bacterium]
MVKIVIVGGGYGGFKLAKSLLKKSKGLGVKVILIDKREFQVLLTALPAAIPNRNEKIVVYYEETLSKYENFEFIKGSVLAIKPKDNKVVLSDGKEIDYDHLVLGVGAEPYDLGIQGVKDNSIMFWNHEDLEKYVSKLDNFLSEGKSPKIVIVGAGPVGIELASETYNFLKSKNVNPDITIIEAKDRVMPSLSPKFSSVLHDYLNKIGVKVLLNSCASKVDNSSIHFKVNSKDEKFEFDILLWCTGVKASSSVIEIEKNSGFSFEKSKNFRILVDKYLKVKGFSNIWALGDVALPESNNSMMLAQFAVQMADSLSKNIINLIKGKKLEELKLTFKGIIVQLSHSKASLYTNNPFEVVIPPSFLGILARKFVDYNYLLSIGGKPKPYYKLVSK